ncbi:MAG: PAS domain-containing protein [Deltaproteobacteria bacterium]|nr:PAS domain-containing protein [Deltaproteobacteria bacterium]
MTTPSAQNALAACADPAFMLDESALVVWANSAFQRLAGSRSAEDIFGQSTLRDFQATNQHGCYDVSIRSLNGESYTQSAIVTDVASGEPGSSLFLIVLKSIGTESSKVAAKEQYLAAVAHDLRNPLSAIFSYADALIDTQAGNGTTPAQQQILRRIRSTTARCVDLVLNYQTLAQIHSHGFLRPNASIDLNEVARSVVEHVWRDDASTISITCDLSASPLPVFIERVQAERVLSNLVTNALKYTPPTGRIVVKTFAAGVTFAVSVNNTGVHIPEHEIKGIFDRYARASSSKGIGGSGLGLYIVKSLMEAVGGTAQAESDPELGVTVTLRFPRSA